MKKILLLALCTSLWLGCKCQKDAVTANPNMTFADSKYIEIGKKSQAAMSKGDMNAWMSNFADNAKYYWNNGDSLVGKPAIEKYWSNRRNVMIENLNFKNDIWLPVNINKPQSVERKGVWLLSWCETTAKYKDGKSMTQWVHTLYHFDAKDKIDQVDQYLDKALINAALPK